MAVRVKHHSKGYKELLLDAGVLADVRDRASRVAEAAGGSGAGFYMESSAPHSRSRAAVIAPMGDPDNRMIRSLGAGR